MGGPFRVMLVVPTIAGLVFLSVWAVRWGMADALTFGANTEINAWIAKRGPIGFDRWTGVQADLERAEELAGTDPQPPELLGALHLHVTGRAENADAALGHLRRALELRPSSPYTWVNVVEAHYRLGMTTGAFERMLLMTSRLGPSEPETQRLLADIGLAMWDDIGALTQSAVMAAVSAGMRRNPLEMLQISERRGRLALACAHVPGDKRIRDAKWTKVCSGEAR